VSRRTKADYLCSFIACQQALVVPESEAAVPIDDAFCERVAPLAVDDVLGVRIGVARLIGILYSELLSP